MPSFLETLSNLVEERGLKALLIGGHAVTALGFPRATYDVDLLIPETESEKWETALISLGLKKIHESSAFLQFQAPRNWPLPPVDLMRVDAQTWDRLATDSKPAVGYLSTPSALSMIALKVHAAIQPSRAEDKERDWSDIFGLIRAQQIPLNDPALREIITTYGRSTALARLDAAFKAAHG